MKDYYKILGIARDASKDDIQMVFRKLAHIYHPDKGGNEEKFKEINDAYNILCDDKKRAEYDAYFNQSNRSDQSDKNFNNEQASKSPRQENGKKNKQVILNWAAFLFVAFVIYSVFYLKDGESIISSDVSEMSTKSQIEEGVLVSNPDYLKNPTSYLVDYENKIPFPIPLKHILWVEDVKDALTLTVSFPIERDGVAIMKIEDLSIVGLGVPTDVLNVFLWKKTPRGKCWDEGAASFLREYLLHTPVSVVEQKPPAPKWNPSQPGMSKLAEENWKRSTTKFNVLLMDTESGKEPQDVAEFVIRNGYGVAKFLNNDYFDWNRDGDRSQQSVHPEYFRLKEIEQVAFLANRGLWSICKIENENR